MITFTEVQDELLAIIDADPDALGKIVSDDVDPMTDKPNMQCVYFLSENGDPLDNPTGKGYVGSLGPPCCIVGHWFHRHPALVELAWDALVTNEGAEGLFDNNAELNDEVTNEVRDLLCYAQTLQDRDHATTWGSIRVHIANATPDSLHEQLHPLEDI